MGLPRIVQLLLTGASCVSLGFVGYSQQRLLKVQAIEPKLVESPQSTTPTSRASADVQALVSLGSRVAGTPVMEQASHYLLEEYRQAGYVAEVQTFTYSKFEDNGSTLTVDGRTIAGQALKETLAGNLTAPLVVVPKVGRRADFAQVDVKGAIAIVQRGEIPFLEKTNNATAAGAVGLIIVNNDSDNFSGSLGDRSRIPVLSLSGEQGKPLLERAMPERLDVTLNVNASERVVTGRNIVAHLEGVTQPKAIVGAHYDSVPGSPGANDNASGTAVILDLARNLSGTALARQVWFVSFDGEEDGLHGSRAFVKAAKPQFLSGLEGMLNFDMVGINDGLRVGGTDSLTALVRETEHPISTIGATGGSDHMPFEQAQVPVLFFTRGMEPNYHQPTDLQVQPRLLDETVQVGLDTVKQLLRE
ncbi:MAG: M28 family peptidase [Kastovskya adunca ATA6-11-RM4]|nr:M28 family peptidase [Kastovskya adunca ATA6-11-RM4]